MPNEQLIGPSEMTNGDTPGGGHRVIPFRPRAAPKPRADTAGARSHDSGSLYPVSLLRQLPPGRHLPGVVSSERVGFESRLRDRPTVVDDRQRMVTNLLALVFVLVLTATAVWLATTIRHLRHPPDDLLVSLVRAPIAPRRL